MNILIVGLKENEQLHRIKEEALKRGHRVDGCFSSELVIVADKGEFEATLRGKSMEGYDLVYLWTVVSRRWEWFTAAYYLSQKFGTKIVNNKVIDPGYNYFLTPAMDFLRQTEAGILYPKTAIISHKKSIASISDEFKFPVVVKLSGGSKGRGVQLARNEDELVKMVKQSLETSQAAVIREFIPNDGDIRVFTVGYKVIGAMKRIPKEGEFRSNISIGGRGEKFEIEKYPEIKEIAVKMSKLMATEIAGVDIMLHKETNKPYVLEVNPGPQFTGLEKFTSVNAALEIVKYFEQVSGNN